MLNEDLPPVNAEEEEAVQFINNIDMGGVRDVPDGINNIVRYQLINEYFNNLVQ